MNNLTDLGGGSVLPSLAAAKKEFKPLEIVQGLFCNGTINFPSLWYNIVVTCRGCSVSGAANNPGRQELK